MHHESNQPGFWFFAIPEGEVHYGPVYRTVEGTAVIDGPIENIVPDRLPDQPVVIEIKKGRLVKIEGGADAKRLKEFLDKIKGDYVSEIGIGTNPEFLPPTRIHEFKKFLGFFHIGYGGWWGVEDRESIIRDRGLKRADEAIPCMIHGDMCMLGPAKLEVDGKVIIENGSLRI
jgi:leucyl aminopeptidase (aminopeptidase T)